MIATALATLSLSTGDAADLLVVSPRKLSRWRAGNEEPDPRAVEVLRILLEHPEGVLALRLEYPIDPQFDPTTDRVGQRLRWLRERFPDVSRRPVDRRI